MKNGGNRGLRPYGSHFIPTTVRRLSQQAYRPASYALLEPEPKEWLCRQDSWLYLMDYITDVSSNMVLLSATILPEDHAFVNDAGLYVRIMYEEDKQAQDQLWRRRWKTRIPLAAYEKATGTFSLPEVVIQSVILLVRLEMV